MVVVVLPLAAPLAACKLLSRAALKPVRLAGRVASSRVALTQGTACLAGPVLASLSQELAAGMLPRRPAMLCCARPLDMCATPGEAVWHRPSARLLAVWPAIRAPTLRPLQRCQLAGGAVQLTRLRAGRAEGRSQLARASMQLLQSLAHASLALGGAMAGSMAALLWAWCRCGLVLQLGPRLLHCCSYRLR